MLERRTSLPGALLVVVAGLSIASCSGSTTDNGYQGNGSTGVLGPAGPSPVTLVSQCDDICGNVVAQCAPAASLYNTCTSACGDLLILQNTCLDPFLSYLTCLAGSTTVQCSPDGDYVLVTPPECEQDVTATLTCNATPGLVSACVALPGNTACGAEGSPVFCVGAPQECSAPSANPLGIGVYCCP